MNINRVFKPGYILLACALLVGNVQASTVFTGSVSGRFDNPVAGQWDYIDIDNNESTSSTFSWGLTRPEHGYKASNKHRKDSKGHHKTRHISPKSSNFMFESASGGSGFSVYADRAFSLGDFTYTNEATYRSRHVEGVDFSLALELDGYGSTELTYMLSILNTPNSNKNPADFVSLLNSVSPQSLQFGNDWYELEILGFSRDGGSTFATSAWLNEGQSTTAEIYAQFNTMSAVPVPAAAWLFGSGLLWLATIARKPMNRKR